ncbi:right-handed parallel beta-helix repeat-containing protein [Halorussus salinisoli]|uniref:right-handed parallel beta-helix repeat-containing protein n=1 Tax=Halorussus salinisoli TaxID=2558242 RepID=UPI0010C1F18F|nr:right-handed parallel beta-helix repeat-containing protein [Halorussus salinisoli]
MSTRVLIASLVVLSLGLSAGATSVGGTGGVTYVEHDVTEDTTWSAADGPYRIAADVTIEEGATLGIEPGTTVQPAEDITITVEGNLTAEGTADEPITFTTATQAPAHIRWASIRYDGTSESRLSLSHVTIENATNAVTVDSGVGRIDVTEATIRNVSRNGIRIADVTRTPRTTVDESEFTDIGERGIAFAPGTGAVRESSVVSRTSELGERTMHKTTLTPAADTTMDALRVSYLGHGDVGGVDRSAILQLGIDTDGDEQVDRSLKSLIESVGQPKSNAYEITFDRSVTVPADASLVAVYDDVRNPRTYGTYPVEVSFERKGVEQTAKTTIPFDVRTSGDRHRTSGDSKRSHATRLSITESTFDAIEDQGVFVAADAVHRLRIAENSFTDVRGSGISIRGERVDSVGLDGNSLSALGGEADGIRIATQGVDDLDVRGNRIADADAGIAFVASNRIVDRVSFASNTVTGSTTGLRVRHDGRYVNQDVSLTVVNNTFSRNDRYGVSVVAESGRLRDVTVRGNEITANGESGIQLVSQQVRESRISDNRLAENRGHGLSVLTNTVVHNLSIAENRVFDNAGVGLNVDNRLTHAGTLDLTGNVVAANAYGIRLAGSLGARVLDNTIVYNTYGDDAPVRSVGEYRPGTGIVVEEGDAGAVFRAGDVNAQLAELIDDPEVETGLERRAGDDYTLVLRPDEGGHVWKHDGTALTVRSLSEEIPTGITLPKDDDHRSGVVVRNNDVYGHARGMVVNVKTLVDANTTTRLLVNTTRTVVAERNYWGDPDGPTHSSIHPEGTGDLIVTRRGWVDFLPIAQSPFGPRYHRPTANVTVSPSLATVGNPVLVSGVSSSDEDGRVTSYRFVVDDERRDVAGPNATVSFTKPGTHTASLLVEDDVGIESDGPATVSVEVLNSTQATAGATTTANATTAARQPTTTKMSTEADSSFVPEWAVFTSLGGFVGLLFYGTALLLGAYGTLQTFRDASVPVQGATINGLAGFGILVWVGFGLFGTDGLLTVGVAGAVLWVGLVALLWAITQQLYD